MLFQLLICWFKESHQHLLNPLPLNPRFQEIGGALIISNVQNEDQGSYRCVSRNSAGEISSTLHLSIKHQFEASIHPQIQTVDVGQRAIFHCKIVAARGKGLKSDTSDDVQSYDRVQYSISWLKDGQPAQNRPRVRIQGSKSETLEVLSVFKEDSGVYQCFINQGQTQYLASGELRLGDAAPNLQYAFIDQTLQPGPFVSLKCSASGSPTPQIQWKLDGFPLPQNDRFMIGQYVSMNGDVISHLNISSTKVEDGGLYSCEASSRAGSQSHSSRLNIYGPPVVRSFPDKIKAIDGKLFILQCPVSGYPIQEVSWKKDGVPLISDMRRKVFSNGSLEVGQVVKNQEEGIYTCEAKNRQGQTSKASTQLQVMVAPKIVPFSSMALLQRGERVTITCTMAKGDVPITIQWLKDGTPLAQGRGADDDKIKVITFDHFNSMLTIDSLELIHVGNYTCQAANPAGIANHSQAVFVNVPPSWVVKPSDVEAIVDHLVELPCVAEGSPKPSITWKKETGTSSGADFLPLLGSQVHQSGISIYPNGSLIIANILQSHSGRYLCNIDNGIGQPLHQIVNITVRVPPRILSHKTSHIYRAALGDKKIQLECQTEGDLPIKVKWTKEGDDVMSGPDRGRFSLETHIKNPSIPNSGMNSVLSISNISKEDATFYECIVTNPYGRTSHKIKLLVQEPPLPPVGLQVLEVSSQSVRLSWEEQHQNQQVLIDVPDAPLRISKYIIEIAQFEVPWDSTNSGSVTETKFSQLELPGHVSSALVGDLRPFVHYKARIYAENSLGKGLPSSHISFWTLGDKPSGQPRRIDVRSPTPESLIAQWEDPSREHWNGDLIGYIAGFRQIESENAGPAQSNEISADIPLLYNWTEVERYDQNDLRLWLRGLRPYTQYEILVQAFNQYGRGPMARAQGVTLSDVPSESPSNVECKPLGSTSLQIRWGLINREQLRGKLIAYKVIFQDVEDRAMQNDTQIGNSALTLPSHSSAGYGSLVLNDLRPYTNYSVMVTAETEMGEGPYSLPIFCSTEQSVPGSPADVKVVSSSDHSVVVSWLPPTISKGRITSYTLYKRYKSDGLSTYDNGIETEKSILPQNSDHTEVHGLRSGVYYQFFISANGDLGEGNTSTVVGHRIQSYGNNHLTDNVQIFSIGRTLFARESSTVQLPCKYIITGSGYLNGNFGNIETNWTKDGSQDNVLLSPSLLGRVSIHNNVLQIQRLRVSDSGKYSCRVQHKISKSFDAIDYDLKVLGVPTKPKVILESSKPHGISLILESASASPILWCKVFHKPLFGDIEETILPAKNMNSFVLRNLLCGKHYDISGACSNVQGESKISDVLRDVRTVGQKPLVPKLPTDFVHPTNVSVRLDLFMWNDDYCPVDYFVVSYKRSQDAHWTLVSNNLKMTSRRFTIRQLDPETNYELRIRANNEAGSTEFKYSFETVSTMRASGAQLADGNTNDGVDLSDDDLQLHVVLPVILGILLVVITVGAFAVCVRKKAIQTLSKPCDYQDTVPRLLKQKEELIYSAPNQHSPIRFPNPTNYIGSAAESTPEYADDIYPYATFVLPEAQCHSSGTIGHPDRLILHETPTLPMSDKSSTSNPYTMVHKPKRRRKRHRGSLPPSRQSQENTLNAMSRQRSKQPQMGLSFRQHQMELMHQKPDHIITMKKSIEINKTPSSTSEDQDESEASSVSEEDDKIHGTSSRTESSNQLDHENGDRQVWIPISNQKVFKPNQLVPANFADTDTLPSSDADDSHIYYEEQDDTDCDRVFIKQNNQFVSVKAHEIPIHANSHLVSPVMKRAANRKSSRDLSETECDRDIRIKNISTNQRDHRLSRIGQREV